MSRKVRSPVLLHRDMSKRIMADAVGADGVALRLQECPQSLFKLLIFQDLNKHIMADGPCGDGVDIWSTLAGR